MPRQVEVSDHFSGDCSGFRLSPACRPARYQVQTECYGAATDTEGTNHNRSIKITKITITVNQLNVVVFVMSLPGSVCATGSGCQLLNYGGTTN